MKKTGWIMAKLACVAVWALATHAVAGDTWYVGGDLGQSRFTAKPPSGYSLDGISQSRSSTAFELFAGYKVNPYIAVELGYLDLGKYRVSGERGIDSANASAKASGFTLAALWKYPINEQWSVFARTGMLVGSAKTELFVSNPPKSATYTQKNYSGVLPVLGLGVAYAIDKQWELRAQYQDIGATSVAEYAGSRVKLKDSLWSLGLSYAF